jgi:uncharacterized repeat protein (TIGR04052 family)
MNRYTLLCCAVLTVACGPVASTPDAGTHSHTLADLTTLSFKARVGTQDFACGQTYQVGSPPTQYQPRDFRLYVHDVVLTTEDGRDAPFVLTDDAVFQRAGVALLDFENKASECSNGTLATHTTLEGTAAGGHYHRLSFTLGVPFDQNHQDAAAAQAPLNSTAMFWSWMGGYKFLKVDGVTTGLPTGHNIHVGSTACVAGATPNSVASCSNPNRLRVTLDFDPQSQVVVLDLAALVATANLDTNLAMSAPGCMSAPTDTDCAPIFSKLGLPFGGVAAGPQAFFKAQ